MRYSMAEDKDLARNGIEDSIMSSLGVESNLKKLKTVNADKNFFNASYDQSKNIAYYAQGSMRRKVTLNK